MKAFEQFFSELDKLANSVGFNKLTLSMKRDKKVDLKSAFIKCIELRGRRTLSIVYRYPTTDKTKNFNVADGLIVIRELMENFFYKADLMGLEQDLFLSVDKQGNSKLKRKKNSQVKVNSDKHDRTRKKLISAQNNVYLQELDIVTPDGKVKRNREDKFRQINRFTEIMSHVLGDNMKTPVIADMGCGKGYLTFALYDYLFSKGLKPKVIGVELRPNLVEKCNSISKKAGFEGLSFESGYIGQWDVDELDVLIALHACNTATDDAIYQGIKSSAKVIVCAPCCHKQVRKSMKVEGPLKEIAKHGILLEREAEILTDALRSMYLEVCGYKTRVMEFISTEHTAKNLLIIAEKRIHPLKNEKELWTKIQSLKDLWGIREHYLESLIKSL